jgi:hypothetical protein
MKIQNHKSFDLFHLPAIVFFSIQAFNLSSMPVFRSRERTELRPVWNVFAHIHSAVDSSQAEDLADGMSQTGLSIFYPAVWCKRF